MGSELPCMMMLSMRRSTAATAIRPGLHRGTGPGTGLITCTQASIWSMAISLSGVTSDSSTCHQRLLQHKMQHGDDGPSPDCCPAWCCCWQERQMLHGCKHMPSITTDRQQLICSAAAIVWLAGWLISTSRGLCMLVCMWHCSLYRSTIMHYAADGSRLACMYGSCLSRRAWHRCSNTRGLPCRPRVPRTTPHSFASRACMALQVCLAIALCSSQSQGHDYSDAISLLTYHLPAREVHYCQAWPSFAGLQHSNFWTMTYQDCAAVWQAP